AVLSASGAAMAMLHEDSSVSARAWEHCLSADIPSADVITTVQPMSYQAEISRASPTAIVMVMDQSTSMNQRLKSGQSKANFLAECAQKDALYDHHQLPQGGGRPRLLLWGRGRLWRGEGSQRLSRRMGRRAVACRLPPRRGPTSGRDPHQEGRRTRRRCGGADCAVSDLVRAAKPGQDGDVCRSQLRDRHRQAMA